MKTKIKTIDGIQYYFKNHAVYENTEAPFSENFKFKNTVFFNGLEEDICKVFSKSDFKKKINFENIDKFHIDSVSFSINKFKNKIDLIYFLDLGSQLKSITMVLEKEENTWMLY
ncbi:hypothetical protein [Zhouia amylolytica]|uniref:Uncharacterized protein n=1 Tax=Zhouia amylolytica AD3 TaxID=1286632 RepID=W2UR51_9FLAO|nr:hypothetical protein [Zhouia amylolytica]ETN96645.1 hypothetical protein P278_00710 [Zhouia amylolytica AD3]